MNERPPDRDSYGDLIKNDKYYEINCLGNELHVFHILGRTVKQYAHCICGGSWEQVERDP